MYEVHIHVLSFATNYYASLRFPPKLDLAVLKQNWVSVAKLMSKIS